MILILTWFHFLTHLTPQEYLQSEVIAEIAMLNKLLWKNYIVGLKKEC